MGKLIKDWKVWENLKMQIFKINLAYGLAKSPQDSFDYKISLCFEDFNLVQDV